MKKFIINLIILTGFSLLFGSYTVQAGELDTIAKLNAKISTAQNGDTITLTDDITISNDSEDYVKVVNEGKTITLDFQNHTITSAGKKATIIVENNTTLTITGNGTVKHTENNQPALIIKNGDVIIENGTFAVDTYPYYAIHVGDGNSGSKEENNVERQSENFTNTLTIKDATITNTKSGGIMVMTRNSKLDIENVNLTATDNTAISTYSTTNNVEINIKDGSLVAKPSEDKQVDGLGILGTNINLNISGGTIEAPNGIGINSNNSGNTSTINISGGHIKAHVGMYQPEKASTTISGGTIEGSIGIVARQGLITITGGTIIGNDPDGEPFYVGYKGHDLTPGVSIIVDNKPTTYGEDLVVNITGGIFSASAESAIVSYEGNDTDFKISGGEYNKSFNNKFIEGDNAEVQIDNNYYVGKEANEAIKNASSGKTVTVLQGNLEISNVPGGVTVLNNGNGKVSVNGHDLSHGESITIPKPSYKPVEDTPKKEEVEIVSDVVYEDNGDGLVIEGTIVTEESKPSQELEEVYDKMVDIVTNKGYSNIFNMYEFHVKGSGNLTHSLTITFNVGEVNNGKLAYVLHQKHDGSYEEFERVVKDGKVIITVDELSPFVVALKDNTVSDSDNVSNPQTNDEIFKNTLLLGISLFTTSFTLNKIRNKEI